MLLRITLLLFFPFLAFAQTADPFGKGWQLSLTVDPSLERFFTLTPHVTAADTLLDDSFFGRLFGRRADTISLNGQQLLYWQESGLEREVRREQSLLSLLTKVRAHYRFNSGVELSLGFAYEGYTEEKRTNETEGLPNDFYYFTSENRVDYLALVSSVSYHFRKRKKLQPYVGLILHQGINRFKIREQIRSFPGLGVEQPVFIAPRFQSNTIFDFDLDFLAGVQYQLGKRWSAGIEGRLGKYLIPVPTSLQVRCRFVRE